MTTQQPDIRDNDSFGICDAAKVLGVDRKTIARYCAKPSRAGGIRCTLTRDGRRKISGAEILKFWRTH